MDKKRFAKKIKYAFRFLPDKAFIQLYYFAKLRKFCNFKNPKTFNEKIQWLKLYDRNPLYSTMVDKYEAKKYVASIIGEEYIVPTLGVWDRFEDIDFDTLPKKFVLKCTHDSDGLVICRNKSKLDIEAARKKINDALRYNFYYIAREWPYKNVKPRIIAEEYLEEKRTDGLSDYKMHCFNGNLRFTLVCTDRFSPDGLKEDFYDENWNHMNISRPDHPNSNSEIGKPEQYELMQQLAVALAKNISFARIDFYEIEDRLYFGEITFYPNSGFEKFVPESWDTELGKWLRLPGGGIYA